MLDIIEKDEKKVIVVPKGVRYISKWSDYSLDDFQFPHILDKKIPGCGYTEFCIRNDQDLILCSPRKILLENKEDQHIGEVFYVKNQLEKTTGYDKDLTKQPRRGNDPKEEPIDPVAVLNKLKLDLQVYITCRRTAGKPVKILVTYDSFRIVRDFIGKDIENYQVVIDEFQSILVDSRFKSGTEMEFLIHLQGLNKVCFVSATPMIDKYLKRIEEFAALPYYELDWGTEDPLRISKPDLKVRVVNSIITKSTEIIETYKTGDFEKFTSIDDSGNVSVIQSREAVFYVNSVNNILSIIKKNELKPEEVNLLCANTPENVRRIKSRLGRKFIIGKVPKKGEPHKMFTFCTRTVYLGADFYSTNARTFIMSDANIESLSVDISLDLPQILGRQRLEENPWNNRAEFYYKTINTSNVKDELVFKAFVKEKIRKTNALLENYDTVPNKLELAEKYEKDIKFSSYKDDYIAVNKHSGSTLIPAFNNLVLVAEERAFDIQQIDYRDRFTVFSAISGSGLTEGGVIQSFLNSFENNTRFYDKMKMLCESGLNESEISFILEQIPITYKNYYLVLGPSRCKANGYNITEIEREYKDLILDKTDLKEMIYSNFKNGDRYLMTDAKEKIKEIYEKVGYKKTPKATDLEIYFEIKRCKVMVDGVQKNGFEILKKK